MTPILPDLVVDRLPGTPSAALALPVDLLVTGFLVALLVARLVARAAEPPGSRWRLHPVDIAALPLTVAFGMVAVGRILEIVPLG